ncbi:unnamed protein product, partial [Vitis vinifera]
MRMVWYMLKRCRLDQKGLCHRFVQLAGKLHKHPKPWITSSMDGFVLAFYFAPSGSTDHGIRHPIKLNSAKPCRSYIERSLITGKLLSFVSIILSAPGSYPTGRPLEGADSRTIFVNNVHFTATKDSLSRHFNKFGEVAAGHALSLDGTSFMSRILKVVKRNSTRQEAAPCNILGFLLI